MASTEDGKSSQSGPREEDNHKSVEDETDLNVFFVDSKGCSDLLEHCQVMIIGLKLISLF